MRQLSIFVLVLAGVIMFGASRALQGDETLPVASGAPAAGKLPADVQASKVAFETATFGLG